MIVHPLESPSPDDNNSSDTPASAAPDAASLAWQARAQWLRDHFEKSPSDTAPESVASAPVVRDPHEAPWDDHAHSILAADSSLTDERRADTWDAYHASRTPQELVRNLSPLEISTETKQKLFEAKSVTAPVLTPAGKVANALKQMSQIDPKVLQAAESHPHVAKAFIDAATKESE